MRLGLAGCEPTAPPRQPMYPTLYHAFLDLFGLRLPPLKLLNTFGFMVALAFLAAARTLSLELARKHAGGLIPGSRRPYVPERPTTLGDVFTSGILPFVVGFKLFGLSDDLQGGADTQRYLLSTQGHLWAGLGCALAWMLFRARELGKKVEVPKSEGEGPAMVEVTPQDHTVSITGAAALGGLIGAKVFHWLERPASIIEFFENPSMAAIFSGLTIYGGLIVGTYFVYRASRRANMPFVHVGDAAAPGLMLAYAVGRLGCQLSGDGDWGIASTGAPEWVKGLPTWLWSFDFPNNVLGAGVRMAEGGFPGYGTHLVPAVYPTPMYEAFAAFLLFLALWGLRRRMQRPLVMFGVYMMFNGFERFWIEKIRVNSTYDLFGFQVTQAELISVLMFVGGAALIWRQTRGAGPVVTAPAQPSTEP